MSDISLLPESFREQEEQLKKTSSVREEPTEAVSMHIPQDEQEDVEIIEVDESEVSEMLMTEPLYSRLYYKVGLWFDGMREKLFKPQPIEPAAKLPPQFFTPPKPKASNLTGPVGTQAADQSLKPTTVIQASPVALQAVATAQPTVAGTTSDSPKPSMSKARIIPSGATPRNKRVRIIKRIRKPVHVSLLDQELMYQIGVDVPKRQYSLAILLVILGALFGAGYLLLDGAQAQASDEDLRVQSEYRDIKSRVKEQQDKWTSFQDLEARLLALNELMDGHVSMSNALEFMETHTLPDVFYGNFNIDSSGRVNLVVTAGSMPSAARQILIFKEAPELASAEASSFSLTESEDRPASLVQFQLAIQFKPEALRLKTKLASQAKDKTTAISEPVTVGATDATSSRP